jgi:hypothetical protein
MAEIVKGMPAAEYHARADIGSGALKALLRSPAHYQAEYINRVHVDEKPAYRVGTLTHTACLEPDHWALMHVRGIDGDGRTKAVQEARKAQAVAALGKTVVPPDEYDLAEAMAASVRAHKAAGFLLREVDGTEISIFWEDEVTGVACKGRLDCSRAGVVIDLKTCQDASPAEFARSIANYGYGVQAAHYLDGYRATHGKDAEAYVWIAVEKTAPHVVAVYAASPDLLSTGRTQRLRALDRLCECRASGVWPGYSERIESIDLPRWAA